MNIRCFVSAVGAIATVVLVSFPAAGQDDVGSVGATTMPRTAWGAPDLQGVWNNNTSTPLERPDEFADRAVPPLTPQGRERLTEEELSEFAIQQQASREDRDSREGRGTDADVGRAYNAHWYPVPGEPIERTSLVSDPSDGRLPPLTPQGRERLEARAAVRAHPPAGPEDRNFWERCISRGVPRPPGGYNNHFQIVQTPEHVVILLEMVHEARIIPLDGRTHLGSGIRQRLGDSRGHWEGDTLVVDTTNFVDQTEIRSFRGRLGDGLHLVERFTRVDAQTLNYEVTVDDPTTFTRPWTAAWPATTLESDVGGIDHVQVPQMFEYACHEGNYGLLGQLAGARVEERTAAAGKTKSR